MQSFVPNALMELLFETDINILVDIDSACYKDYLERTEQ